MLNLFQHPTRYVYALLSNQHADRLALGYLNDGVPK